MNSGSSAVLVRLQRPLPGDAQFASGLAHLLQQRHARAAAGCFTRRQQPGGTCSDHYNASLGKT